MPNTEKIAKPKEKQDRRDRGEAGKQGLRKKGKDNSNSIQSNSQCKMGKNGEPVLSGNVRLTRYSNARRKKRSRELRIPKSENTSREKKTCCGTLQKKGHKRDSNKGGE